MSQAEPSVLERCHRFVARQLESEAAAGMSPEQALAPWREQQEAVVAIREGLADIEAGRTKSVDEFDRDFKSRHKIEGST